MNRHDAPSSKLSPVICLHCATLNPSGAVYCTGCQYTIGCRRCHHGHKNSLTATACAECGSRELSQAALYLPFSPVIVACWFLCSVELMCWLLHNPLVLIRVVVWVFLAMTHVVTVLIAHGRERTIMLSLEAAVILLVVLATLPGHAGSAFRGIILRLLKLVWRIIAANLRILLGEAHSSKHHH
jgi:ribosomal protein L40E